jgi:hypothetical protein
VRWRSNGDEFCHGHTEPNVFMEHIGRDACRNLNAWDSRRGSGFYRTQVKLKSWKDYAQIGCIKTTLWSRDSGCKC